MDRVTEIKWVDVDNEEGNSAKMHAYYLRGAFTEHYMIATEPFVIEGLV